MSAPEDEWPEDKWIAMDDEGFIELVGPLYHRPFDGGDISRFRFLPENKHRNRNGVVHGGMLLTFADRAMGFTARRGEMVRKQATVQLEAQFIRAVRIGDVVDFEGRILRQTRHLVFVSGLMTVEGEVALSAQGVWKLTRPEKAEFS